MPESPVEPAEDVVQEPRLLHFKVPYDGKIEWSEWARKLFDGAPAKILVMAEHLNKATGHVHMQGVSSKTDRQVKRWREDFTHEHCLYKEFQRQQDNPDYKDYGRKRCRLIQTVDKRRPCNETGFQYMCKEFHPPLFSQGFTKDELKELHEKSEQHVEKKKMLVNEALDIIFKADKIMHHEFKRVADTREAEKFMKEIRFYICELYRENDMKLPKRRYFSDDVINALYQRKDCSAGFRRYLAHLL